MFTLTSLEMANQENISVFEFSKDDYNFTSKPWNGETMELSKLNVKRATERRDPQNILYLNQPFDPKQFNFTKIKSGEILFRLQENCDNGKTTEKNGVRNDKVKENKQSKDLIIINVSPLEFGHVLAVPDVDSLIAQKLSEYCVRLSLQMMLLSNHRDIKIIVKLDFMLDLTVYVHYRQLIISMYMQYYLEHELYVESCPVRHISGPLYELDTMPTKGFAFQLHGMSLEELTNLLFKVTNYFQESEIAHNFFMTKGTVFGEEKMSDKRTVRVYVWPRKKYIGIKDEAAFNVATVELAGHLPIKITDQYHSLTVESIENTLRGAALDEAEYQAITDKVIQLCS
ncbi:hypothetical protein KUTeg_013256 [Tegillarca granosa]|uniref:GDP-D-glucose phosphorylase 1 n=1 Tax=Tegillarca granosa TaxID=220873 RepID=A0ABQ9EXN7_TEGGR|nr:hypothetical protein KUTeg_013256 [Tegillarca granosa]